MNSYTDNIQDAERPGDALVAELLSGDKSGTVALREGPRGRRASAYRIGERLRASV